MQKGKFTKKQAVWAWIVLMAIALFSCELTEKSEIGESPEEAGVVDTASRASTSVFGDVINEQAYAGIIPDVTSANTAHACLLKSDGYIIAIENPLVLVGNDIVITSKIYTTWSGSYRLLPEINFNMEFDEDPRLIEIRFFLSGLEFWSNRDVEITFYRTHGGTETRVVRAADLNATTAHFYGMFSFNDTISAVKFRKQTILFDGFGLHLDCVRGKS